MTVLPGRTACYRCSFREPPPNPASCSRAGVLGAIAGMLGTIQAAEAVKYITGAGTLLTDALLTFDAATMTFRKVALKKRSDCPVCGDNPSIRSLEDHTQAMGDL